MPLVDVELDPKPTALPSHVVSFLEEADRRIDHFLVHQIDAPVPGFVPSDFPSVYHVLHALREAQLAPGDRFCEWGSGFGVVASLAGIVGFEAYGIEINEELHAASEELAEDFDVAVEFAHGSFLPEGADQEFTETLSEVNWLETIGESGYDLLELDPDDFDVIYAFPWPGEQHIIANLFERYAAVGALLITYQEQGEIFIRRKTSRRK